MKKILYARVFESLYDEAIPLAAEKLGWDMTLITYFTPEDKEKNDLLYSMMKKDIQEKGFQIVFTINFWPLIADLCEELEIPYVSWSYDSPQIFAEKKVLSKKTNYIFAFDRAEVQSHREQGMDRVFHMPLAAGVSISQGQKIPSNVVKSDVSLVGSLYSESAVPALEVCLGEYNKGWLRGILGAQQKLYGHYMIPELLTDEKLKSIGQDVIQSEVKRLGHNLSRAERENALRNVTRDKLSLTFAEYLTYQDRLLLLRIAAKKTENTDLYTWSVSEAQREMLSGVHIQKPVKYLTEMPYVFEESKVNLCPTLRCIQSGIPLRALDVMACGGLLMMPVQEELLEYFAPMQDAAIYSSLEEASVMMDYLLTHEEDRLQIARNGQAKVKAAFQMEDRLQMMMDFVLQN